MLSGPDVVGSQEACAILKVGRERLKQLRQRPDFPPSTRLQCGHVWEGWAIRAYHEARTKPRREAMYRFACSYRATGNLSRAARHVGIHRTTGVLWVRELGMKMPSEMMDANR